MEIPGTNLSGNQLLEMYVAYQILSAFVQSLPEPREGGNVAYSVLYKFLSLIIADFKGFTTKAPTASASKSITTTVEETTKP